MKPSNLVFFSMLVLGTLISISANSWFLAWFGMEMNLIGLIPLLIKKENISSSEAAMKYFFVQSSSSTLLIVSATQNNMSLDFNFLILLSLMIKLGAAPFHFWVPSVSSDVSWLNMFMILTWQKVAPLLLVTLLPKLNMMMFIILSLIIGAVSGFNQTVSKKIMAFSSISHLAWLLTLVKTDTKALLVFFSVYSLNMATLTFLLAQHNTMMINSTLHLNSAQKMSIYMSLLSLGGMPPLLGFFPKIFVIIALAKYSILTIMMLLVFSTLINLYFYLRLTYSAMSIQSISAKNFKLNHLSKLTLINMLGPMVLMFY